MGQGSGLRLAVDSYWPREVNLSIPSALIQEGRIAHECDSPEGQALEDGIRSIVIRLEEAAKSGLEFGGTH